MPTAARVRALLELLELVLPTTTTTLAAALAPRRHSDLARWMASLDEVLARWPAPPA